MKLIVGLGNPGLKYRKTRHNVGFMFNDDLVKSLKVKFSLNKQLKSMIAEATVEGEKVIIIEPQTYMNLSGEAVEAVMNYYKIDVSDVLVIYDDLDLPVGKVRIRPNGSSGGHNGMKNIIEHLKTSDIKRVRIGIGSSDENGTIDYVLGRFSKDDAISISIATTKALDMVKSFIAETFDNFMSRYNG